jgi:hypothetical protein
MWVYECDSTGELDTQVMVSCDTPWFTETYIKVQSINREIKSLSEGSSYSDHPYNAGSIPYVSNYSYSWYTTRWRNNPKTGGGGTDCIFFKPYDTNSNGGYGSSPTYYKGLLTNYTVLGKTYARLGFFRCKRVGHFHTVRLNHGMWVGLLITGLRMLDWCAYLLKLHMMVQKRLLILTGT